MAEHTLTEAEALERLRGLITYERNQTDLAKEIGVTRSYVYQVLSGKAPPSPRMLEMISVERRTQYVLVE